MGKEQETCKISVIGTFTDQRLEQEFFSQYMEKTLPYLRPMILASGILYLLFFIPDYFLIADQGTLLSILINRIVFCLLVVLLYFAAKRLKNYTLLFLWITAYEIYGGISFLIVFQLYPSPNYLIQAFGVITMISVIFILPNRWINMLFASVFVAAVFFAFSWHRMDQISLSEFSAGIAYILIILVLSGASSFKSNYHYRKQYVYSQHLLKLSATDSLTGIYNRAKWDEELEKWLAYRRRYDLPLSVIFFDIDNFKNINDMFGHLAGDQVIVEITDIVRSAIRESDVFSRWGGDEFMLLLPNTERQQALNLAERLRTAVADHPFNRVGTVTCSFGLSMASRDGTPATLVKRTDQLLYTAKLSGRNSVAS